jgi:glyoxylase-like metal-dependent hydrolase (beta-lactamase superfamily II)
MTPEVFSREGSQSIVSHQPITAAQQMRAMQAMLSCPTASIGTVEKPKNIRQAQQSFPIQVAENVYHCGYHAESSFGAASYFIQHPEGNILVDSPRFAPPLVRRLEAMGGIRYLYLTHRDDVADHQKFRDHFQCDRILHADEITPDTQGVEIKLTGTDPIQFAPDLLIIPVPGHTKGHTVLLYKNQFLFSGDHLAWSAQQEHLVGFREVCWYSWDEQKRSTQKLSHYDFEWVLPGHGRRYHAKAETMRRSMQDCLTWMGLDQKTGDWD